MEIFCANRAAPITKRLAAQCLKWGACLSFLATPTIASAAPAETAQGYITFYGAGWVSATVRVQLGIAFTNPDGCSYTDGYVTDPTMQGNELFSSTLLTAYVSQKKVSLVIDGCKDSRPRIIGVYVWP